MISGTVIRVVPATDVMLIHVQGMTFSGVCVIPVVPSNHRIATGDQLSWQGRFAWWTSKECSPVALMRAGLATSEQQARTAHVSLDE